jgi:hypothetical protein
MTGFKKIVLLVTLSMLWVVALTGCSGSDVLEVSSDGTNIYLNGEVANHLSEYDGYTGKYESDTDPYHITYQICSAEEMKDCPDNRQGVHEDDLSEYKDSTYFDAYLSTLSVMYVPLKGDVTGNKEAIIETSDKAVATLEAVRPDAYENLNKLDFAGLTTATFADKAVVNSNGGTLIVRQNGIVIPGTLVVSKGVKEGANTQEEVGGITVMKYESNNYNFYQYGDCVVKIVKSANISDYVQFK